jgi:hypothetical protein
MGRDGELGLVNWIAPYHCFAPVGPDKKNRAKQLIGWNRPLNYWKIFQGPRTREIMGGPDWILKQQASMKLT